MNYKKLFLITFTILAIVSSKYNLHSNITKFKTELAKSNPNFEQLVDHLKTANEKDTLSNEEKNKIITPYDDNRTILHEVAKAPDTEIDVIEFLIKQFPEKFYKLENQNQYTPFELVLELSYPYTIEMLIKNDKSRFLNELKGSTFLHTAAWSAKSDDVITLLIDHFPKEFYESTEKQNGLTPFEFIFISKVNYHETTYILDKLLSINNNIDRMTTIGKDGINTPLHNIAKLCIDYTNFEYLLNKFPTEFKTLKQKNNNPKTPLELAKENADEEIKKLVTEFKKKQAALATPDNTNLKKILKNLKTKLTQLTSKLKTLTTTNTKPKMTVEAYNKSIKELSKKLQKTADKASPLARPFIIALLQGKLNAHSKRLKAKYEIVD